MRPYHDDNSPLSELAQQAISEGEAAWERISSGDWDVSAWQVMGAALTLLRQQTLHETGIEVPRGGPYNEAFAERVNKTKFATMPPVTRSDLLYLMEPEIRVVLDRLLASWTPAIRAKRTHPTTLRQHVRAALKPKPQPKPAPTSKPAAASAKPASSAQSAEPVMTLDMISTKSGQEQAKAFMRQCAKWIDAEIELGVRASMAAWEAAHPSDTDKKLAEADHVIKSRRGVMKKALYSKFRFAVHEDTYKNASAKERAELCQWLEENKKVLLDERELPTGPVYKRLQDTPEWKARQEKLSAEAARAREAYFKAKAKREAALQ